MKIGIGLPNLVPDATGTLLVDWARQAESSGFSTLATIGRVAWPAHEELVTLAAAAAVTQRITFLTDVLLAPTREPVMLAIQAATLDRISGGRFVMGLGVGGRKDDFDVSGLRFTDRGKRTDQALELMHRIWKGDIVEGSPRPVGQRPTNGVSVPLMFGGRTEPAFRRAAQWGIGYTQGTGGPDLIAGYKASMQAAWAAAGRSGTPEYRALTYFALGPQVGAWARVCSVLLR